MNLRIIFSAVALMLTMACNPLTAIQVLFAPDDVVVVPASQVDSSALPAQDEPTGLVVSEIKFDESAFCAGLDAAIIENGIPAGDSDPCDPATSYVVDEAWNESDTNHLMQQKFTSWASLVSWLEENKLDHGSIWAVSSLKAFDSNFEAFCNNEQPLIIEDIDLGAGDPCAPLDVTFWANEPWGHGVVNPNLQVEFETWKEMVSYLNENGYDHGSIWAEIVE
jgi:hypothetical protein